MNPEIKAKWVAALQSGQYVQGKGQLRNNKNQFCCLGVLCNLHAQAHPEIAATQLDREIYLDRTAFLPEIVKTWCGLSLVDKYTVSTLMGMNDRGKTFKEISQYIDKEM